ncbi:hypothetical protein CC1G_05051 [Coprinopsis cinerea okayama7|uniref:Uncharacterized protein n=1 Tax=Coprinopsis cinerea (strain Okayama-7 / 130 / ATCC MYA-4618 / FGSC 9003) TaxID=240176 RepID=A8NSP4_COPC7|nr:hypothetical protein CC1G_05051 [Coprinopsis cinerea okayama7\|eukprot:XP_001836058.1 hypothetical protein CC1G_05051 [Coprinopsis cinerea okayama7\
MGSGNRVRRFKEPVEDNAPFQCQRCKERVEPQSFYEHSATCTHRVISCEVPGCLFRIPCSDKVAMDLHMSLHKTPFYTYRPKTYREFMLWCKIPGCRFLAYDDEDFQQHAEYHRLSNSIAAAQSSHGLFWMTGQGEHTNNPYATANYFSSSIVAGRANDSGIPAGWPARFAPLNSGHQPFGPVVGSVTTVALPTLDNHVLDFITGPPSTTIMTPTDAVQNPMPVLDWPGPGLHPFLLEGLQASSHSQTYPFNIDAQVDLVFPTPGSLVRLAEAHRKFEYEFARKDDSQWVDVPEIINLAARQEEDNALRRALNSFTWVSDEEVQSFFNDNRGIWNQLFPDTPI